MHALSSSHSECASSHVHRSRTQRAVAPHTQFEFAPTQTFAHIENPDKSRLISSVVAFVGAQIGSENAFNFPQSSRAVTTHHHRYCDLKKNQHFCFFPLLKGNLCSEIMAPTWLPLESNPDVRTMRICAQKSCKCILFHSFILFFHARC